MLKEFAQHLAALATVDTFRHADQEEWPSDIVSVPEGRKLDSLERFQTAPNRIKHKATLLSTASFSAYLNRFKGEHTSVYVDIFAKEPRLTAIIDHHGPDRPSWGGHVAIFAPKLSMEWLAWKALHALTEFSQHELLAFIEDHANDLLTPSPARMLTAAKTFEAVETHTYKSAMNLDNGNMQIEYVKDGGQRKVEFPHSIKLGIPILENEEAVEIEGRFRYRTAGGRISFMFQLKQDPARVERDALGVVASLIQGEVEDVAFYEGAAS